MEADYGKNVVIALVMALAMGVFLPALLIFLADPCHIFHKPFKNFLTHGFIPVPRCQYAGIINSYLADKKEGFDSIIIGSSLSDNFRPEYTTEKTSLKRTMKLSIVGIIPIEQNILAEKSIATENIKHIYWETLPYMYRIAEKYNHKNIQTLERFPAYLYNNGRLDDYRYIFNQSTISASIDILLGETSHYINSIDRIGYWENTCYRNKVCSQFYSAEDIAGIQNSYVPVQRFLKSSQETQNLDYSYFDLYVYGIIDAHCNKNISFDLFFPPISLLSYAQLNEADFDYEMYMLRHVVRKVSYCSNVRVFSFMNEKWITADLSNYHDPKHFYGDIHDFMIDAMAENKNRVTLENIDDFEKEMIKNINEYRPYGTKLYPH